MTQGVIMFFDDILKIGRSLIIMSRHNREKSSTGFYHVMVRGINKNNLFLEDDDKKYYLKVLADKKEQCNFLLPAYCLMDNHVHMLIKEQKSALPDIMKRVNVSYAGYFNRKYNRVGPFFQGRYKSEVIEDEKYFQKILFAFCLSEAYNVTETITEKIVSNIMKEDLK